MKKKFNTLRMAVLLVLCLAVTAIPGMASAYGEPNVTGYISTVKTTLNYTFTTAITLSASPETDELSITDIVVQNNQGVGRIKLVSLALNETLNGWKIQASGTDFKSMPLNSRKFSLVASLGSNKTDMSSKELSCNNYYVDAGETATIKFNGQASGTTYEKNERALLLVLTVFGDQVSPYVKFNINSREFNTEYEMSWAAWLNSELSSSNYYEADGEFIKEKDGDKYVYDNENKKFPTITDNIEISKVYITKIKE